MKSHPPTPSGNIINWGYTRLVYPLFEPASYRGFGTRMDSLRQREMLSLKENQELQWRDLLKLLKHAQNTCPFYQRRFAEWQIRVEQIQSPNDLRKLPTLTRESLRLHLREIRSNSFIEDDLHSAATGGTTDTPVPILRSSESLLWKSAVQWRFNSWAGMRPGDKVFYLWGARQDYSEKPSWRWRLFDRHLMRRIWAPTSVLNRDVFESHRKSLNELRPKIIYAYPTPLALFCEFLRDSRKPFHRPASTICTAEPLLPEQRQLIEEVLGCSVFEHYGSREFGMIAGECEQHGGMHLNPASVYMEFLPLENSEAPGLQEILVTDLLNYGMPLIRYRPNDCVLTDGGTCACGRGYSLIRQVIGRTGDVFQLPNGDRIPGVAFTNRVLQVCPGLTKTQIIQETLHKFTIRYVPGPGFSTKDLDLFRTNLHRFMPDPLEWTFEQVSEIPREKSGKTRFCISRLAVSPAGTTSGGSAEDPRTNGTRGRND
jgi:phenylacetate-CoA ligase